MIGFAARQLRRLVALVALAAMLLGAPYALYKLGLPLLPDHIPGLAEIWQRLTGRDTGQVFLGFLVIVGAVAWAIFAVTVLLEIAFRIAHRPDWHLPGLHLPQAAAGALIGMLIAGTIATTATPAIAASLPQLPHPAPAAVTSVAAPFHVASPATHHDRTSMTTRPATRIRTARPTAATGPTWTVSKGDSLWSIADKTLGSGRRYGEIAALNQGRTQPDGRTLEQANFLLPGWILQLPTDAHLPAGVGSAPEIGGGSARETVVVEPGDTLSLIALDELGDASLYPEIAAANHIANPGLIHPGQTIHIPQPEVPGPAAGTSDSPPQAPPASTNEQTGPVSPNDGSRPVGSAHHDRESTQPKHGHAEAGTDSETDASSAGGGNADAEAHAPGDSADGAAPGEGGLVPAVGDDGTRNEPTAPSVAGTSDGAEATGEASNSESASSGPSGVAPAEPSSQRTPVLGGVTALAAALAWAGLIATRRRLEQSRRPGQRLTQPSAERESRVERAMRRRADPITPDRINRALRTITPILARQPEAHIAGALIGPDTIELRPADPAPPPAPFTGGDTAWTLRLPEADPKEPFDYEGLAALPALATVGITSDGRVAMVNLEQIGALHVGGDEVRDGELINHLVIELSQSPWTDGIHLHITDLPRQTRALDTDRIQPVHDLPAAVRFLATHTKTIRKLLRDRGIGQARTDNTYADTWEPHVLVADGGNIDPADAGTLIDTLEAGPPAAVALVTIGTNPGIAASVDINDDGTAVVPAIFGTKTIMIAGATDAELAALASLFAARPGDTDDLGADDAATDAGDLDSGSADTGLNIDGGSHTGVVIPEDETSEAATTLADALPSKVGGALTLEARGQTPQPNAKALDIEPRDPDAAIDADLVEWWGDAVVRPKIAILGPAQVTGRGQAPDRTQPRQIEMAVYLALYSQGVSADKFAADLWPEGSQPTGGGRRVAISRLRTWLGEDPASAEPFIPNGEGGYYLTDRIVDSELFNRLVRRSERRAKVGDARDALGDLQRALELVRGPILPEAGGPQYVWLAAADRMEDRTLPMAVIDAAHAATDLALAIGDVAIAESAAMTGRRIEPYSTIPLADLIRIAQYCGDEASAAGWAQTVMTVSEVDVLADLPAHLRELVANALLGRDRRRSHDERKP